MLSEPRTISMITELVHLPITHAAEKLREVYNEVCRTCGYENFLRVQGGARIERGETEGEGFSQLVLLRDRIQLTEDHTGISVDQFGPKAAAVVGTAMQTLGIPVILVQQTTVRVTAVPNSFRTAAEYLARSVFRIRPENLEPLARPTNVFGFRLVFPPTPEHPQNYNVRVECYVRDARALYIENVGTFKVPIQPSGLVQIEKNLQLTSEFVVENLVRFLSAYDRRETE